MARFRDSMLAGWPGLIALIWLAAIIDSLIHQFIDSSDLAAGLAGWLGWAGLAGCLGISLIFMDFQGFQEISWTSGVRGSQPLRTRCCP